MNIALKSSNFISFCSIKKSQFHGFDLACVEKFKAPIEKFYSLEDLKTWALRKIERDYFEKDFQGRRTETQIKRKNFLYEWKNCLLKNYPSPVALLILKTVFKDIKEDNDKLMPVLDKEVLQSVLKKIEQSGKYECDLNKIYKNELSKKYLFLKNMTGWIKIPSRNNDEENFERNVEKLKILSHSNWCTKSSNAESYLEDGDFYIYFEKGKPKVAISQNWEKVREIQGEKNNDIIPWQYVEEIQEKLEKENLDAQYLKNEIHVVLKVKKEVKKIKNDLREEIKNKETEKILEYFKMECEKTKDGFLKISHYCQPSKYFTFEDLGIKESDLFERIKVIKGDVDFAFSSLIDTGNLEVIEGNADFRKSRIENLKNLKIIGKDGKFSLCPLKNSGKLEVIKGDANFINSRLKSLSDLKYVGKNLFLSYSQINDTGKLNFVGENIYLNDLLEKEDFKQIKGFKKINLQQ